MKKLMRHVAIFGAMLLFVTAPVLGQFIQGQNEQDKLIDSPMSIDPLLPVAKTYNTFDDRLAGLWFQALNQTDSRTRFEAAAAIASAASQGMTGLDMMTSRLASMVESGDEHFLTRQAAAKALVALNAKEHAKTLWQVNETGQLDMVLLTSPALAGWGYEPALEGWRQRLADESTSLALRINAARSLGLAKDKKSLEALSAIALDKKQPDVLRLAAARSLVSFATPAQSAKGVTSTGKPGLTDKLVTVTLLQVHQGATVNRQLAVLANDVEPAVAVLAARQLLVSQPEAIDPLLDQYSKSGDVELRKVAIEAYTQKKEAASAAVLASFLNDQDPLVRVMARDKMITLAAEADLRQSVVKAMMESLSGSTVLAQQQAALGVGAIDLKEASARLLELINSQDAIVALSAAASLRKLQVAETLEPALDYVKANVSISTPYERHGVSAQLIQLMGIMKYEPAEATFLKLVPKNSGPSLPRAAAIWSLGKLHEGEPVVSLIRDLTRRANDGMGMEPEDQGVREQSAIAIGRMKDQRSLKLFERWMSDEQDQSLAAASRWAVGILTGNRPAEPEPAASKVTGWFIEPLY